MDPVSDMLIRIKNAVRAGKANTFVPYSNFKFEIASVLMKKGYLASLQRKTRKLKKHSVKQLELEIAYNDGNPKLHDIKRVSKQSRRFYKPKNQIFKVKQGYGTAIISTSRGVMADVDAKKAGVGGEIIAEVW